MSIKLVTWDAATAQKELRKRLDFARDSRSRFESRWEENERTVYSTSGFNNNPFVNDSFESDVDWGREDVDNSTGTIQVNYAFKNLRFIHAQLSANPPSVVVRPTSNDQEDRRKADAADRLVRYALRQYKLQEMVDRASLNCLVYGTGYMKTVWNSHKGDIIEMNEEDGSLVLEGDIDVTVPSAWNIFVDPDAQSWEEVRYVFERILLPYDEACFRFAGGDIPDDEVKRVLEANRIKSGTRDGSFTGTSSALRDDKYDAVELYEYWETGLPTNGYLGRHCICTKNGQILQPLRPSPFRFKPSGAIAELNADDRLSPAEKETKIKKIPSIAKLPYHIFTDIDVPDKVMGRSFVEYVSTLQDTLNRLDSTTLDNVQAHGVARMVLPESAEISDESITNSPWDVIKITGNQGPWFAAAPQSMPLVDNFRASTKMGIDDMSGVNEAMFGQQSRETSGFSMQYATNQGNMIRRRLFNKYVLFVEGIYRSYLNLVRKHWSTTRTIYVLGKEKALEAVDIQGADIDGGFDLVVEYGASLSLDPTTRRDEIMALQPMFEKAGVPPRVSLKMMKLNELEGMYDMIQMAEDRQREIFEEMVATGRYIPPRKLQDHDNMLAYALQYVMTTEFKYLEEDAKVLIEQHIQERGQMSAQEKSGLPAPGGPMPPGPAPAPGTPPVAAGMTGEQATVEEAPPIISG